MPISFDLEDLRTKHNCVNYFETGLWNPQDNVSSKFALYCKFDKQYFFLMHMLIIQIFIIIKKNVLYLKN